MVKRLYPGGKAKAFNISYDDGVLQDVRFVEMLNQYGLKGTFNLNSGLMRSEFSWIHGNGMRVTRLSESAAAELYRGHEVCSHTLSHPYMESLSEGDIMRELETDKRNLQALFGREIQGFAVPFLYYSDLIADCVKRAGFEYARISEKTDSFDLPRDPYRWRGSKFHWDEDLEEFVENFLASDQELALCQLVGHSYDLDALDLWDTMDGILRSVSRAGDVCPMTNLALVRYSRAMDSLEITDTEVRNHSAMDLWLEIDNDMIRLHPGDCYNRRNRE